MEKSKNGGLIILKGNLDGIMGNERPETQNEETNYNFTVDSAINTLRESQQPVKSYKESPFKSNTFNPILKRTKK